MKSADLPEKRYYSIGELANAFEVNTSLIRFWEKEFDQIDPKKNAKGDRKFRAQDVKAIERIFHLVKERGFTLEGAKKYLKQDQKPQLERFEMIQKLKRVKEELQEIKNQL